MSGLRIYVHDAHGRHVNGHVLVRRARTPRPCGGYQCERESMGLRGMIQAGEWYGVAAIFPSDEFYSYLDRETSRPLNRPVRLFVCRDCIGDSARDLLDVLDVGSEAARIPVPDSLPGHERRDHCAGGYNEPREEWVECSCGAHIWAWQEFYDENPQDPDAAWRQHMKYIRDNEKEVVR